MVGLKSVTITLNVAAHDLDEEAAEASKGPLIHISASASHQSIVRAGELQNWGASFLCIALLNTAFLWFALLCSPRKHTLMTGGSLEPPINTSGW